MSQRKKTARLVVELDDSTGLKFTKMVASLGHTKKYVISNLIESFLIEAEGFPTGHLFRGKDSGTTKRRTATAEAGL